MGLFGKTETVDLRISGMTCGNCVAHVTKALDAVPGVKGVDVDLEGTATVTAKQGISRAALVAAVDDAGYSAE